MQGRELLKLLLNAKGMNGNSLSKALNGKVQQPQINKFLNGVSSEPRRSTMAPIAEYFAVPIDAFYDEFLADKVAYQSGFIGNAAESDAAMSGTLGHAVREASTPIPLPPPAQPSLRDALKVLRNTLAHESPGVRRSVAAIMADLADRAEDEHFSDQMIERIMGALGQRGNEPAPQSIPSPKNQAEG